MDFRKQVRLCSETPDLPPSSWQWSRCCIGADSRGGLWVHVAPEGSLGMSCLCICALRPGNVLTGDCIVPSLTLSEVHGRLLAEEVP